MAHSLHADLDAESRLCYHADVTVSCVLSLVRRLATIGDDDALEAVHQSGCEPSIYLYLLHVPLPLCVLLTQVSFGIVLRVGLSCVRGLLVATLPPSRHALATWCSLRCACPLA